jgi:hypothetical protein
MPARRMVSGLVRSGMIGGASMETNRGLKIGAERRHALQQIRNAGGIIERSDPHPTEVQVPVILKRGKTSGIMSNPVVVTEVAENQRIAPAFEIDHANRDTK